AISTLSTDPPETRVTLLPPRRQLFTGDNVTLICDVGNYSTGWRYSWYKDSTQSPALHGGDTAGTRYTVHSAALSHSGQYWCRVGREDASFHLNYSQPVSLQVTDEPPRVRLSLSPEWTVLFPKESVTLRCGLTGDSSAGQYNWYRAAEGKATEPVQCQKTNGDNCLVTFKDKSHNGLYWCEAQPEGERSASVHIRVVDHKVILQTPPLPLTEGDNVTLVCRDKSTSSSFYKDNKKLLSDTTQNILRISPVRKDAEGIYRCQHSLDSEEVQISVR
ncbi:FCGR1 protein, partial [Amia calva]|nr:FCGR1 protein [Amia calva]